MNLDLGSVGPNIKLSNNTGIQSLSELAIFVSSLLSEAVRNKGHAVLSVSGGKSSIGLYEALSLRPLPWEKITVTLVDERYVAPNHEASNAKLIRRHLLQGQAAHATFRPIISSDGDFGLPLSEIADRADTELADIGPSDITILGMGDDGHTASLFPGAASLDKGLSDHATRNCIAVELPNPPENAPFHRLSQTLAYILRSKYIILPVAGSAKLSLLKQALQEKTTALPISYFLHQDKAPVFLWSAP